MYARWFRHGRSFDLGRMTMRQLVSAYATHPAVHLYLGGVVVAAVVALRCAHGVLPPLAAMAATAALYPVVWYVLHRFVLHGKFLYRSPLTAGLWKRIHFDHHQDPHRMDVLFGSPATTLPTILGITIPLGLAIGGVGSAAAAAGCGLLITCGYEFCHCVQHLNFKPRSRLLRRMKELHLAHHFHDEHGNYGITSFAMDRVLGTYYAEARERRRSPHVFNLGYDRAEAERFPWVAELSGGPPRDRPPPPPLREPAGRRMREA
ncbi:MAG: sterol desaturase family protein [Gluconacetobacter diazotrophicus]|nr:sterol desaturase family protein [Gluconacetobacter diazotrophicus]